MQKRNNEKYRKKWEKGRCRQGHSRIESRIKGDYAKIKERAHQMTYIRAPKMTTELYKEGKECIGIDFCNLFATLYYFIHTVVSHCIISNADSCHWQRDQFFKNKGI